MWSRINPSLYSVCFTGKAQGIPHCSKCASIDHMVRDCPFSAKSDLERMLQVVFAACTAKSNPGTPGESAGNHSQKICRRWNDMRCTFANCLSQLPWNWSHPIPLPTETPSSFGWPDTSCGPGNCITEGTTGA